jgi:hypothetical protein
MQFTTFTEALTTVFTVMTLTWVDNMHSVVKVYGWGAAIYFVEIIVLGNFLLLNLFLAILLKQVESEPDKVFIKKTPDYSAI